MNITSLAETGFVRLPAILAAFPASRCHWWKMVKAGKAPMPFKLSERTTAWHVADIRSLLTSYDPAANDAEG